MRLKDKIAIVTGAGRGIGEGIARVFSQEGAKVTVVDRDEDNGGRMAEELGSVAGRAAFFPTDLTKSGDIQEMIAKTVAEFGRIDILVNNVGYHISKNAEDTSEEEWEFIQNTNLRSAFLCSKYAMPELKKTKGCIINMSSMVGKVGQPNAAAYSATKGGIIAMTKNLALDYAADGVRVNVICPGWIATPLVEDWFSQQDDPEAAREYIYGQHPLGRIGTIEECGHLAAFLAGDQAGFITGAAFDIDGGVTLGY